MQMEEFTNNIFKSLLKCHDETDCGLTCLVAIGVISLPQFLGPSARSELLTRPFKLRKDGQIPN
jgi:hypothetical protein